ncbi:hypothetical protein HW452_05385 [Halomonas aquamarina]|uniref:Uncharacterized protein n=1 Tax=Vreelandella aquamarina TaxID=77097 RepID=A0ACC5VTV1_9GAMM|nr:hypothetical protein [Halomonas aquamarina]MBZ5486954.1 hypothetical protein [Halomonas aquamarina]
MGAQLLKLLSMVGFIALLAGGLAACDNDKGPAQSAGERIDEGIESAGESIEEAGESMQNAAEG